MRIPLHLAHLLGMPRKPSVAKPAAPKSAQAAKGKPAARSGEQLASATINGTDTAAAVKAERERCAAIFGCEAAKRLQGMAAELAFRSDVTVEEAIGLLTVAATGPWRRNTLADRMSRVRTPNPGVDGGPATEPGSPGELAAAIVRARAKARGEGR